MKITFCGAAQFVAGSCYLIETGATKFLIDCGMYQGPKEVMRMNYEPFLFDPSEIDFVLLTHAHIDHCGLIPKLHIQWFEGKIYATSATKDLTWILLEDSADIQLHNTEEENKRRKQNHLEPRVPLFTLKDAMASMRLFSLVEYGKMNKLTETIQVRYQDAWHIIGSAHIELFVTEEGVQKKFVFSGDIGQRNTPIVQDPTLISEADYVFMESTYGDRLHEDVARKQEILLEHVIAAYNKGGKLLIPSFAVERTQELLYFFSKLIAEWSFPKEKIFLDSPLAIKATEIFKKHIECFDDQARNDYVNPFDPEYLQALPTAEDSKILNNYQYPCIVIAGNGMCTAGRIVHHLKHGLSNPKNSVLFVGYQAEWTLGRYILEGEKMVRMMGDEVVVHADIDKMNSFSAHADANELVKWAQGFAVPPKNIFIMHGEGKAQEALQTNLRALGYTTSIPKLWESVVL